jgi:hypothetical protein
MTDNNGATNAGQALGYTSANLTYKQMTPVNLVDPRTGAQENPTDTPSNAPDPATQNKDPKGDETWEKRYADLRSYTDKRLDALVEQNKTLLEKLAEKDREITQVKSAKRELPASEDELKEFSESYPVWDRIIEAKAMKLSQGEVDALRAEVEALRTQLKEEKTEKAKAKLKDLHPDWEKLEKDPVFNSWFAEQPEGVKNLIRSSDIYEIARGLDLFKKEIGIKTKRERDLEASLAVKADAGVVPEENKPKIWTTSEIKKLSPREYEKLADEINKAMREGRIRQS